MLFFVICRGKNGIRVFIFFAGIYKSNRTADKAVRFDLLSGFSAVSYFTVIFFI